MLLNKFEAKMRNFFKIIVYFFLFSSIVSCGGFKKVDSRKIPISGPERAKQNIKEGRGASLKNIYNKGRGTNYEFSTSNPMWRATLDILDFLPLSTVDYSGGVIISDWYTDNTNKDQALKITVRFLSNIVQTNSIKVTVHRKKCSVNQTCNVELFKSRIQEELIASILKEATILEKSQKK
tara:strand:- start:275 stop:814 length:540 start_codon:yes stop_codon:yes gene_type:complete